MRFAILAAALLPCSGGAITLQLVADNDFALFAGNNSNVTRLLYQNNDSWMDQIPAAASFSFNLQAGEDLLYILVLGGGGQENVSGTINGHNIITLSGVQMSSNLAPSLDSYNLSQVAAGTYSVGLLDLQDALQSATWTSPSITYSHNVPFLSGAGGAGFEVPSSTAVALRFTSEQIAVPVPELSTYGLLLGALALAGAALRRRRPAKA